MTVYRRWHKTARGKVARWVVDVDFCHADGRRERIRKTSPIQTRKGAEQFDREIRARLARSCGSSLEKRKPSLFSVFSDEFMTKYVIPNNKPS